MIRLQIKHPNDTRSIGCLVERRVVGWISCHFVSRLESVMRSVLVLVRVSGIEPATPR